MAQGISWLEIFSIVASLVSIVLAGFAIWLSVKFYEMAGKSTDKLEQSSNNISSTTQRLETLFDKLYSDTFSMVKDTMKDMRQHVWKIDQLPTTNEERYTQLKNEMINEFKEALAKKVDNSKLESMRTELESLAEKLVSKSRKISEEINQEQVLNTIKELSNDGNKINLKAITKYMGVEERDIIGEVFELKKTGTITWDGMGLNSIQPITLLQKPQDA